MNEWKGSGFNLRSSRPPEGEEVPGGLAKGLSFQVNLNYASFLQSDGPEDLIDLPQVAIGADEERTPLALV